MGAILFTPIFLILLSIGFFIPDKYMDPIIKRLGGSTDDSI